MHERVERGRRGEERVSGLRRRSDRERGIDLETEWGKGWGNDVRGDCTRGLRGNGQGRNR